MTGHNRQSWLTPVAWVAEIGIAAGLACSAIFAQAPVQTSAPPAAASELIQKAQTVSIPIQAFSLTGVAPVKDLQPPNLTLNVESKPVSFQLSRPWSHTVDPKTGQAEDQPNMLIILPAGGPLDRNDIVNKTVAALKTAQISGWNISILDDSGNQTAYTRQLPLVISELEKVGAESPQGTNLADWRQTAAVAIASMRDLPGRRVVLSLGDLFHEIVYQNYDRVYDAFEVIDVATAARAAGAVLYSADSVKEVDLLRRFPAPYSLVGAGPWMLLSDNNFLDGWICGPVADTLRQIRDDGMAAYDLDIHLTLKQMDGLPHVVSVTPNRAHLILNAPSFYMAPSLAQLQELAKVSAPLRQALKNPPTNANSPLQLATQMEYFPHRDGKSGTQIVSTGLLWTGSTPPPAPMELVQQFQESTSGFKLATTVTRMEWYSREPLWNTSIDVTPGFYRMNVAAADPTGKITAGLAKDFNIAPTDPDEMVRISSLVIGRSCIFVPPGTPDSTQPVQQQASPNQSQTVNYLRAGNCTIQLEPSHSYSPQDVVWTLVRITPVGKLANRPFKDWKGDFYLVDAKGSTLAKQPIHWLQAEDGSYVGTSAFQLSDPRLKLEDGEHAVVLRLKGPGIEEDYSEDAPFMVFGTGNNADSKDHR